MFCPLDFVHSKIWKREILVGEERREWIANKRREKERRKKQEHARRLESENLTIFSTEEDTSTSANSHLESLKSVRMPMIWNENPSVLSVLSLLLFSLFFSFSYLSSASLSEVGILVLQTVLCSFHLQCEIL